ncbi:hypothetical protein WOB59_00280 [Methylocystis sp. IM4]|uniref:hypothetical protein n=1 Tax=Methylocystis sp. IM4 TaxID=3136560 RepID=UPI00311961E2
MNANSKAKAFAAESDQDLGQAYGGRGEIYRWLRTHYDFVDDWRKGLSPTWDTIAAQICKAGVVNRNGKKPAGRLVRRIWQRVCRDVTVEREREAAERAAREALAEQRRGFPSRQRAVEPLLADARVPQIKAPEPGECRALVPVSGDETAPLTARQKVGVVRGQLKQLGGTMPMAKKW